MAKGYGADATLVSAAFRMGQSRVPADTSKIFQAQYRAIGNMYASNMRNFQKLIEQGTKTLIGVSNEREFNKRANELKVFNQNRLDEINKELNNTKYGAVTEFARNSGHDINQNYANGKGSDAATTQYVKNEILSIKDQIKQLESMPGELTQQRKAQIQQLYKSVDAWRNENNESLADRRFWGDHLGNDNIDWKQSFQEKSMMTDEYYNNPNLAHLATQVLHPGINLNEVGIQMGRNEEGVRGYYYDPNIDRTKQHDSYLKGIKQDPAMQVAPAEMKFISEKELFSGLKVKDNAVVVSLGEKMMEEIKTSTAFEDTFQVDATGVQIAKGKKLKVKNYDEISEKNEKGYYDLITAQYASGPKGSKGPKRNIKTGLIYMSNNTIDIGGKPFNYSEYSKSNPNITSLTYQKLGLSGAADINGIPGLQADELLPGDMDIIHKKLMNPETPEEIDIAAKELARALNLETRRLFNKERGENAPVGSKKADKNQSNKSDSNNDSKGDFTDDGNNENKEEVTAFAPTKESVTKYILANLDKFSFEQSTIEAIKKGQRPFDTLVSYINDPNYKAK